MELSALSDLATAALIAAQTGATSAVTDIATKLGKAGVKKVCDLIGSRFAKDGEGSVKVLEALNHHPTDAGAQNAVRRRLEVLLNKDSVFADEIQAVIGPIHSDKSQHQTIKTGSNSIVKAIQGNNNTVG